jgi:hypothetical protein
MNQPLRLPPPPPGMRYVVQNGNVILVPETPSGAAQQRVHALGQAQQSHPTEPGRVSPLEQRYAPSEDYPGWVEVPAFYTVSLVLGGDPAAPAANVGNSVTIRPEPFVCRRITWATTGDVPNFISSASGIMGSAQGRSVRVEWSDEFTKFLGSRPCLISALFGDSEGFLDFPRRGVLFQGKQTLDVKLTRILWPDSNTQPANTEFDFNFQGVSLLPMGVNQSGSAG